jgi:hypothetical protein
MARKWKDIEMQHLLDALVEVNAPAGSNFSHLCFWDDVHNVFITKGNYNDRKSSSLRPKFDKMVIATQEAQNYKNNESSSSAPNKNILIPLEILYYFKPEECPDKPVGYDPTKFGTSMASQQAYQIVGTINGTDNAM